ncbi:MAG: patatin-like phospholipase family protein [Rhizobiaceae bacterium]|nr:patatin-like phospholipase family protein [Rhizobiaceae bacterium]MCV0408735.1 patatin-like phospholipase family protein [Rhizobiaceae bacterium]
MATIRPETSTPLNVALQGGGSHGAFSWGVLDRLLEDGRFVLAAVSGTSAGAMNAVALADGYMRGGAEGARERLAAFWRAVALKGSFSPVRRTLWERLWGGWSLDTSPSFVWFDAVSRLVSPYWSNPLDINPLREVVEAEIDFANVRACSEIRLFLSATNVETGKLRVFSGEEIGIDVVMASACLPQLFRAVEIDGTPYWDGGYGGNPALYPFFNANQIEDVLLVQINPVIREGTPKSAQEIQNRIDEITFNAGLLREFRAIAFIKELIAKGVIPHGDYRDIRMHRIDADEAFKDLTASSKINAEWAFLEYLRDLGRTAAEDWLAGDAANVGLRPSLDLSEELETIPAVAAGARKKGVGPRLRDFMVRRPKPEAVSKSRGRAA